VPVILPYLFLADFLVASFDAAVEGNGCRSWDSGGGRKVRGRATRTGIIVLWAEVS